MPGTHREGRRGNPAREQAVDERVDALGREGAVQLRAAQLPRAEGDCRGQRRLGQAKARQEGALQRSSQACKKSAL